MKILVIIGNQPEGVVSVKSIKFNTNGTYSFELFFKSPSSNKIYLDSMLTLPYTGYIYTMSNVPLGSNQIVIYNLSKIYNSYTLYRVANITKVIRTEVNSGETGGEKYSMYDSLNKCFVTTGDSISHSLENDRAYHVDKATYNKTDITNEAVVGKITGTAYTVTEVSNFNNANWNNSLIIPYTTIDYSAGI